MFTENDLLQIQDLGISPETVEKQITNYKTGFPFIRLVAPATINHGILAIDDAEAHRLADEYPRLIKGREIIKFVPASGAASRMFKNLFEFLEQVEAGKELKELLADEGFNSPAYFLRNISQFAFFEDLKNVLEKNGHHISNLIESRDYKTLLDYFLGENGLDYANLPKGMLKFHRYQNEESRTSIEEHLVEAAHYACDDTDTASVHFTVSPEHQQGFEALVNSVILKYERRFGVKYKVGYSIQKPSTDTLAVNLQNQPFREDDGNLLFRPGGHGALIENLNDLEGDIVFVKNIDNIVPDRLKAATFLYKKVIGSILIELQREVFIMLVALDDLNVREERLNEMASYCNEKLSLRLPADFAKMSREEKRSTLRQLLDRPIRVCGMVKNEGEPGGGPFWVKDAEGNISLQVVESSQIDFKNKDQRMIAQSATHFNPVDLVCGLKNFKGQDFHLPDYVDPTTGFISEKSKDGKKLKAQELPGLWNGAMANWITLFVEVPIITFNPVKVINDLLRKEHLML